MLSFDEMDGVLSELVPGFHLLAGNQNIPGIRIEKWRHDVPAIEMSWLHGQIHRSIHALARDNCLEFWANAWINEVPVRRRSFMMGTISLEKRGSLDWGIAIINLLNQSYGAISSWTDTMLLPMAPA